jgi:choline monooxygenase
MTVVVDTTSLRTAHALPAHHYFGATTLELERRAVFGRSWQLLAHRAQLGEPGDHVVEDIAGTPVVLLRGRDGVLRAFVNVCRHRAGPVATCNGKGLNTLRCKYHGWLYDQLGRLIAAPEMQDADAFSREDVRLPELPLREWEGLVFVALRQDVPSFDEVYGGITERIAPVRLADMAFERRDVFDVACNWKTYVDNFLEGYHLPLVHPALAQVLDYQAYEVDLHGWYSVQHSPLRNDVKGAYGGGGQAQYIFVFPNIMLNVMPGRLCSNRVVATGPGRSRVEFDYFYLQTPEAQARVDIDRSVTDEIQHEDMAICEAVQRGLESGFYEAGRLSPKREAGVWHFHERLRAAYAGKSGE